MNCKNCGAQINSDLKKCPNCGAKCDSDDGYFLLTTNEREYEIYDDSNERKKRILPFILAAVFIVLVAIGSYYYFSNIYEKDDNEQVKMTFFEGSGVINDNQKVIYVALDDNSKVQYIHGVSLYDYDTNDKAHEKKEAVSTDYEYTKNIDDSFRAIFFFTDDLGIKEGEDYTYTFEMKFSFIGSDDVYTYTQDVQFNGNISEDISSVIFDHSFDETNDITTSMTNGEEETVLQNSSTQAAGNVDNIDYIYEGFWFTQPVKEEDSYIIYALKFNKNNTYTSTYYYKNRNEEWKISNYNGKYSIEDGCIVIDNGESSEKTYYKLNSTQKTIIEEVDSQTAASLTNRRYNSVKNAEDFFGI